MPRLLALLLALACLPWTSARASSPPRIELKDGWYYLDGRRWLINALGYESGARPGETPYGTATRDLGQVARDLARIKAAGFNGIRTWSQMSEAELKVVQASGLKMVFGIWLKPDEDFSDAAVVARDLALIQRVVAYTRKYDCVITYLIMNEPMPEHLRKVGAGATRDLWRKAIELIHRLHPGVPVTISGNTAITEWLDMNLFDVYGRNAYDYKDGANFTVGFAQAQRAITEALGGSRPVLLTEFGRSVSRRGGGLYGGNTLQEQAEALVRNTRDLLDAGVTGLCPFYYADGWWKAGEPGIHNDEAEEWFGLLGFASLADEEGLPRPAWHAIRQYNQALVTSPKNQTFYRNEVPIEAFCQPSVRRLRVIHEDRVILELTPDRHGHAEGRVSFAGQPLLDRELVLEARDGRGRVLKVETLMVLTGPEPLQWPTLELATPVTNLEGVRNLPVTFRVRQQGPFTLGSELRVAYAFHKGWDRAEARVHPLAPGRSEQTIPDECTLPDGCPMVAIYAGVDLRFGRFVRTLGAQRFLYPGTWADPIRIGGGTP
ncbi:hypothetical protein [Geothrix sp. SG200]|uniref:hypothetical protein n=1 Tax=Geothrix sp. SG200 TaxID=2922865 RepID=UPI001FAD3D95|nr:hypothetical protein [Geothrix sp. SG200]